MLVPPVHLRKRHTGEVPEGLSPHLTGRAPEAHGLLDVAKDQLAGIELGAVGRQEDHPYAGGVNLQAAGPPSRWTPPRSGCARCRAPGCLPALAPRPR